MSLLRRRRGKNFFQKLDPETAKKSLCKIAFFLTKHSIFRLRAKFLENGGEERDYWRSAGGIAVLFGAEEGRRTEGGEGGIKIEIQQPQHRRVGKNTKKHQKFEIIQNVKKFDFFFKQKTAYEIRLSLVGSEMCIRDRSWSSGCRV